MTVKEDFEMQEVISKALHKLDGTMGRVVQAAQMAEPGSRAAGRLHRAQSYISMAFRELELCKGGATAQIAAEDNNPWADVVSLLDAKDKLSLLTDEVRKIQFVVGEVTEYFEQMPSEDAPCDRLVHCMGADRAGAMAAVVADQLDVLEVVIERSAEDLTKRAKQCTIPEVAF